MAVAKSLPPVDSFFMQTCPICGEKQRMMIKGLYVKDGKAEKYPDMGYSFCNCRNIFFTKWENITSQDGGFNSCNDPVGRLEVLYHTSSKGQTILITMRDPFFVNWNSPHDYTGFNPRVNYILWDMASFADECGRVGFEVISAVRDMDLDSKTPECYHITIRKP